MGFDFKEEGWKGAQWNRILIPLQFIFSSVAFSPAVPFSLGVW